MVPAEKHDSGRVNPLIGDDMLKIAEVLIACRALAKTNLKIDVLGEPV